jgi:hypothetical protein
MDARTLATMPVLESCPCGWTTRSEKYNLAWHVDKHKCSASIPKKERKPRGSGNVASRDKIVRKAYKEFDFD